MLVDMYERVMVRNNVLCRLWRFGIMNTGKGRFKATITESRTPAPAKIRFAGENTVLYEMLDRSGIVGI